jgi:putative DNA primase/helicase
VRPSLRSAPLFGFDAPAAGTGKSLLSDVVSTIATGRPVAVMSYTAHEADERKRIVAALMAGDAVLSIDNVEQPLRGEALCSVLTQETYQDRRLGVSETIRVPTCCTWLATGNNLTFAGDLATRVLLCRLDAKIERPEEREFQRDLRAYVFEHRSTLVAAALTVLRAYIVAGCPLQNLKPFGRFEDWSALVRSALVWLDCKDPCDSRRDIVRDDPQRAALDAVLTAMWDAFGGSPVTTPDIVRGATESGNLVLKEALELALPRGEVKSKTLACWLRRNKDCIVAGRRLLSLGGSERGSFWRIEKVETRGSDVAEGAEGAEPFSALQ